MPADSPSLELVFVLRLLIAGAFAGVLGWEREHARKPAGFRTHIIVGLGAALFTAIGEITYLRFEPNATNGSDPIRVVQAVATGIGFLGSGIIFVSGIGPDKHVRGLTTAASVWTTAAIGMTCALGLYILAAGATLLLLFVLRVLGKLEASEGL